MIIKKGDKKTNENSYTKPEEVLVMNDNIKTQQDKYHVEVDIIQQVNNETNKKIKI